MADGLAQLDAMIARCKALGAPDIGARVARAAAPGVAAAIQATAGAGKTPLGQPWKAKKGGGRALEKVAGKIKARAEGPIVVVTLTGPDVFHHLGAGHSPRRQVLPDGASVPPGVSEAVLEAARGVFRETVGR
jgi:hypothetical protein